MGADDNDHFVSQGWQRNFGTADKRVAVIDARSGLVVDRSRPIKCNFARPGFMTQTEPTGEWSRATDEVFKQIERQVFERVREVRRGVCGDEHRDAVIKMCTIHLVRSEDYRDGVLRVLDHFEPQAMSKYPSSAELRERFIDRAGHPPPAGYIEHLIESWMARQRSGAAFFESTESRLAAADSQLRRWHLQVVEVDESLPGLALGDIPMVHADLATGRFGIRDALAVGDANLIMAPIKRRLVVFFTAKRMASKTITTLTKVQELNALTARAARNEVACHPDDLRHVSRVCGDVGRYLPRGPKLSIAR